MFKLFIFQVLLLLPNTVAYSASDAPIRLLAGTPILLSINNNLDASSVLVGKQISMTVINDVKYAGKILVSSNSLAQGYVKHIKKKKKENSSEITVSAQTTWAVDGQSVQVFSETTLTIQEENGRIFLLGELLVYVLNDVYVIA